MQDDLQHLRILSIAHFVVGGLVGLFACLPVVYLVIGVGILSGQFDQPGSAAAPPAAVGWIFIALACVFIGLGWAFAVCLFIAGVFLARRRCYIFCLVVAGLACTFQPLGTVLGIFTFLVLLRPSVKRLFDQDEGGANSSSSSSAIKAAGVS